MNDAHKNQKTIRQGLTLIGSAIGLCVSTIPLIFGSIGILFAPLGQQFGWSRGSIGLALTFYVAGIIISSPLIGRIVDRVGAKSVILVSTALFGVALIVLPSFISTLPEFYGTYFAFAILGAGASPVSYSKIIASQFDEKRGFALGLALSGVGVGTALVPIIGQSVITNHGWASFYFYAGLLVTIAIVPLLALLLPSVDIKIEPSKNGQNKNGWAIIREAIYDSRFVKMGAAFLLVGIGYTGAATQLVPLMIDKGLSPAQAAEMQFLLGLTVIVGRLASGFLLDYILPQIVAAIAMLATACGIGVLIYLPLGPSSIIGIILLGLSAGAEVDVMAYMTARYFGLTRYGILYGALNSAYFTGAAIGPVATAISFDFTKSYSSAGIGLISALIIAAVLAVTISASKPQASPYTKVH